MSEQQFQMIYDLAHRTGIEASSKIKPKTPTTRGTAWVVIDHSHEFSGWTKKKGLSRKGTEKGREITCSRIIPDHLDQKEAYVKAFSTILNGYGIKAAAQSRLD